MTCETCEGNGAVCRGCGDPVTPSHRALARCCQCNELPDIVPCPSCLNVDDIMKQLATYQPMTLDEARRRQAAFMNAHGNELTRRVNASAPRMPEQLIVSRAVMEAVEAAFQHWPLRDERGQEYVGNACFRDPAVPYDHVLFKGIPVTYDAALTRSSKEST